jgi:hypothetical protein
LFRIVIIHPRLVGLQVLSFDYLVFSFYRTNEYYLAVMGFTKTGTNTTGPLGVGVGKMTGFGGVVGSVGVGKITGFGGVVGSVGVGKITGFGGVDGVVVAADAVVTNASNANVTVIFLIITLFSCVC